MAMPIQNIESCESGVSSDLLTPLCPPQTESLADSRWQCCGQTTADTQIRIRDVRQGGRRGRNRLATCRFRHSFEGQAGKKHLKDKWDWTRLCTGLCNVWVNDH